MPTIRRVDDETQEALDLTADVMARYEHIAESVVAEEHELRTWRRAWRGAAIAVLAIVGLMVATWMTTLFVN